LFFSAAPARGSFVRGPDTAPAARGEVTYLRHDPAAGVSLVKPPPQDGDNPFKRGAVRPAPRLELQRNVTYVC
jgi:hypothetical protein